MDMRISDRNLGILTIAVIVAVGAWVTLMMVIKNQQATTRLTALFTELGSLQPEDPVTSRGFPVGKVGNVYWQDGHAVVELLLDEPMILREGTVVRNENYSLMGQRRVEILSPLKGSILAPNHIYEGDFEPGIAEAMHLMEQVRLQVISVRDIVFLLRDGNKNTPSIPQATETILSQSELTLNELERILKVAKPKIHSTLIQANELTGQAIRITAQTDSTLRTVESEGHAAIVQAHQILQNASDASLKLSNLLDRVQSEPITQQLLYKKELITQLNEFVTTMQAAMQIFDENGNLKITDENGKPRGIAGLTNLNVFGKTARQKAKLQHAK